MFKLVKILGSNTNVPEITTVRMSSGINFRQGHIYFLYGGGSLVNEDPVNIGIKDKTLLFIPVENKYSKRSGDYIRGFFVNENMIFELSPLPENTTYFKVGKCYMFDHTEDEDNTPYSIVANDGDKVMIIDNDDTQKKYPIKFIINCEKKEAI